MEMALRRAISLVLDPRIGLQDSQSLSLYGAMTALILTS
jgi:hypothetical protein